MITWNTDVNAPCCPGEIVGPPYEQSAMSGGVFCQSNGLQFSLIRIGTIQGQPVASAGGWAVCSAASAAGSTPRRYGLTGRARRLTNLATVGMCGVRRDKRYVRPR